LDLADAFDLRDDLNMADILVLTDYRDFFWPSVPDLKNYGSMDVRRVENLLNQFGHNIEVKQFSELDYSKDYSGCYVLYQSNQDAGLHYKSYIEDVIFWLEEGGAKPLPPYKHLRAHHNKSLMEMMRYRFKRDALKTIKSQIYGTLLEAKRQDREYPVVFKTAEGSGSVGVALVENPEALRKIVKSRCGVFCLPTMFGFHRYLKRLLKSLSRGESDLHYPYRRKFVLQNLVPELAGDFKVLRFGYKYYVLCRENRNGDFRASGSGLFFSPDNMDVNRLLDFASLAFEEIGFPLCALDIAWDGHQHHLLEFQCVHFGPYTLQASKYWFEKKDGNFLRVVGTSTLENEFCRTVHEYIDR